MYYWYPWIFSVSAPCCTFDVRHSTTFPVHMIDHAMKLLESIKEFLSIRCEGLPSWSYLSCSGGDVAVCSFPIDQPPVSTQQNRDCGKRYFRSSVFLAEYILSWLWLVSVFFFPPSPSTQGWFAESFPWLSFCFFHELNVCCFALHVDSGDIRPYDTELLRAERFSIISTGMWGWLLCLRPHLLIWSLINVWFVIRSWRFFRL